VRPTLRRRLLMAAAMLAVSLLIAGEPLIRSFEYSIYDWRVQKLLPIPATSRDVVVIGIDDESLERMEPAVGGVALAAIPSRDAGAVLRSGDNGRVRRSLFGAAVETLDRRPGRYTVRRQRA